MKRIPLTHGEFAVVDDCDYSYLAKWNWQLGWEGYAIRKTSTGGRNRTYLMHRVIAARAGLQADRLDHRNRNKLDNRRANLRSATGSQNQANRGLQKNNKSGYRGVSWHKQSQKWRAQITANCRAISLGVYDDPKRAARAYDEAAMQHFGEFAHLNHV